MKNTLTLATFVASILGFVAGSAGADVCDTPSKLGDMGSFPGEVITISGSLMERDEEMMTNTLSCFEKATGAVIKYSGCHNQALSYAITCVDVVHHIFNVGWIYCCVWRQCYRSRTADRGYFYYSSCF